jgi:hypothetical protein
MNKFQIKNIVVTFYLLTGMVVAGYSVFDDASSNQLNQQVVTQLERINLPSQAIEPLKNLIKQHCSLNIAD